MNRSFHPYSQWILLTGVRISSLLLAEGFLLYLWCRKHDFFLLSSTLSIPTLALRLLLICYGGALLSEYFFREKKADQ